MNTVSSPIVHSRCVMLAISVSRSPPGRSVRPMLPAKSTSPTKARRPRRCGRRHDGRVSGQWRTAACLRPTCTVSPSCSQRVGVKGSAAASPNICPCWRSASIQHCHPGEGRRWAAPLAGQCCRATGVVDVRVREQDLPWRHAQAQHGGADQRQVATGVDDGALHRQVAPDDGAVLLKRRDGNRVVAQHVRRWVDVGEVPVSRPPRSRKGGSHRPAAAAMVRATFVRGPRCRMPGMAARACAADVGAADCAALLPAVPSSGTGSLMSGNPACSGWWQHFDAMAGSMGPPRTDECSADVQRSCTFTGEPNSVHRFAIRAGKAGRPHGTGRATRDTNRRFRAPASFGFSPLQRWSRRAVAGRRRPPGGPARRGRMARVRRHVDCDRQPPHDPPRSNRRASIADLDGTLLLGGPSRPGLGFRAEALVFNDSATGMVGRAVWTDERGDQVYSELRGEGTTTGNRISGNFSAERGAMQVPRKLRILLALRARVRGWKRAGPITRPEGSVCASGTPPTAPGAGGPKP